MEESMKIVISIALGLLVTLNLIASPAQPEIRYSSWDTFKKSGELIIPPLFKSSAVATASAIGHELGHLIAAKALLNWDCEKFELNFRGLPFCVGGGVGFNVTEADLIGPRVAGMLAAGPLAGITTDFGILISSNVATEYKKSNSIKDAIIHGIKKPLFNTEQSRILQLVVTNNIIHNGLCLIPSTEEMDGNRLFKALGFQSPARHYPNAMKSLDTVVHLGGLMYFGLKIYNANMHENITLKELVCKATSKTMNFVIDLHEAFKD